MKERKQSEMSCWTLLWNNEEDGDILLFIYLFIFLLKNSFVLLPLTLASWKLYSIVLWYT